MEFGHGFHERQAEPGAFVFAVDTGIDLHEGLHDRIQIFRRDPDPGIGHTQDASAVRFNIGLQNDRATVTGYLRLRTSLEGR
jgi:hypothetical protein